MSNGDYVRYSFGYYRGYYIGLHAMFLDVGLARKIHNSKVKAKGTIPQRKKGNVVRVIGRNAQSAK